MTRLLRAASVAALLALPVTGAGTASAVCAPLFGHNPSLRGGVCVLHEGKVACAGFVWTADTYCVPPAPR